MIAEHMLLGGPAPAARPAQNNERRTRYWSLGAVIVLLLWFYLMSIAVLTGA